MTGHLSRRCDVRRFLIAGRVDGRHESLAKLRTLVRERRPDGVLFAGGVLGDDPASHTDRLKGWEEFFGGLGRLSAFTAVVPGAAEVPLRAFLRVAKDAEV